ncbi:MAG: hypothetical protein HLUCCX14_07180 [Marinobacter excellens HL-55]|uniref:Bacteriophage coat protein B n=1 Tax=Marinobacter excellens HL-55 TaxID=1305731 RepID=A0A0P7YFN1_9GAMM|nr:MAG: hypothetical protein HLUCCX14_07180 [Marinobacter excellens HL-55]
MSRIIDMQKEPNGKTWAMARSRFGRTVAKVGTAVAAASATVTAHATILPTDFSSDIDAVGADITTVGGALIGLAVIAVGIKWVKATFFG